MVGSERYYLYVAYLQYSLVHMKYEFAVWIVMSVHLKYASVQYEQNTFVIRYIFIFVAYI